MPSVLTPLHGRTILLVEDDYMIAMDMADHLRDAGANVLGPVACPEDALDLIADHAHDIDVAVLDVNLGPGKTAYPIADRLAEIGVPYVFATGDVQVRRTAPGPVLEKPVLEVDLLRVLIDLLSEPRSSSPEAEGGLHQAKA